VRTGKRKKGTSIIKKRLGCRFEYLSCNIWLKEYRGSFSPGTMIAKLQPWGGGKKDHLLGSDDHLNAFVWKGREGGIGFETTRIFIHGAGERKGSGGEEFNFSS